MPRWVKWTFVATGALLLVFYVVAFLWAALISRCEY